MNPSVSDVAQAAGVSTATVSRAMRNLPHVTLQTRARILKAAAELGYSPSRSAAALASGRTQSIGLVASAISRWFFAEVIEGVERTLREADMDALLYFLPDTSPTRPRFEAEVLRGRVDGVVVASLSFTDEEAATLQTLGVPTVFVSVRQPGFIHVGIDDTLAARQAVGHLLGLGHRVIGHIGGPRQDIAPYSPTYRRRLGWRDALLAAGLAAPDNLDIAADFSPESGLRAMHKLLDSAPDLTAVFAASDEMAMGAVQALHDRGLAVGQDVSVIGVDGHHLDDILGLTSVVQPVREQGAKAAELLLAVLSGGDEPSEAVVFPTYVYPRRSTGVPNRRV
ncbi:MAG: LacI family transcriptional regulator [Propionibacteriaceae bacterium]|nr:LacI family transcriptional regulator [Propionibacteriaceae bacterium]